MIHAVLWQRIEGFAVLAAGLALFVHLNDALPWWAALLIFFAPDLSFIAYALGPRVGAFCYNLVHIYGLGAALLAIGLLAAVPLAAALGALWLAHCGLDRMLGYGLKSPEGFSITHLGRIGRQK
ncbi:DUF4260 family protein [Pelagibacterium halotolerans]|uniref:DUF4260 domain-containing protein n=1 Tax=Pelagibacterium halotolerans (strain DSM 22347 / JCM 15775 / CGMCC 1.7692 / B2) TaxID=1082931 RepID=G4RF18_PELHB|nr:DUF4260 family protein [Pelagibacterium halotolerans]AEQ52951.1 hypothetical protein KKY_2956 [Pelagibacterium halotolerans B2]QJR17384.1 DUF4260 family protein [Pelagibacterium halotolerans]